MLRMIWGERSGRDSRRRIAVARRGQRPAIEGLEPRIVLSATDIWVGGQAGNNWSNGLNWQSGSPPAAGDNLVFPSTASGSLNNDLNGPVTYNSIAINGPGYTLGGDPIGLTSGITANYATTGTSTYQMDTILMGGTAPISVATSDILDIPNVLSGSSGVSVSGGGTLDLSSVNTYTGTTTVNTGTTLQVDGTIGGVQLQGGTIVGNGTIGTLTSVGGQISPGLAPATGTLTVNPSATSPGVSVTLDSGSSFATVLDSSGGTPVASELALQPPSGVATESLNLGNASLVPTLASGYSPSPGDNLTIISNGSGSPVNGIFAGLAEGAAVSAGSSLFRISYLGGTSGNDVVLTNVAANGTTTTTLTPFSSTSFTYGQSISLTATVVGANASPTGIVEFFDGNPIGGGTVIASAPVNGGVASTATTTLGVLGSPHQIYALYIPASSSTYAGSTSAPGSVSVTPATLTVSGVVAENKQYDATTTATVDTTGATVNGLINGDQVTLQTNNVAATFATANAGSNIPVAVTGLSIAGVNSTNYVLQQPTGLTANITPAPLTLVATDQTTLAGASLPTLTFTAVGLQGTDTTASLTTQPTLTTTATSTSPAGSYPIFITGGTSSNYAITDQNGTLTVVTSDGTTTTLTTSGQLAVPGQAVTFTAMVSAVSPGLGSPTGTVAFIADGSLLGLSPLNSATGQATLTTSTLAFGAHTITAEFLANAPFQDSVSSSLTQFVSSAGTAPTLTLVPVRIGHRRVRKFELIAQIVPTAPATGIPTGTVTFFLNSRANSTPVHMTNGTAILDVLTSRLVNKYVYVRYNGTQSYIGSASRNAYVSYRSLVKLEQHAPGGSLRLALRRPHPSR